MADLPLIAEHRLGGDADFAARVQAAVRRVARDVLGEDPSTPGQPMRIQLAVRSLGPQVGGDPGYGPAAAGDPEIRAAASTATGTDVQAAIGDDLILDAVRRLWNPLCGWTG
ncbi:hypothetical protein AB0K51_09440 [Kitasatospora sp. NPDC049285]|uniref:hypothetical protein n=1 Tax=Kitasatospora sp. NPDC049285 TaxID=3157096 RepID=UPI003416059A